uniref:Cystatin domain-containing protein n=1 Tax=Rhabditophanes sp. KR3021 TaxID=114890 RepID=A0AC35UFC6_9BILA
MKFIILAVATIAIFTDMTLATEPVAETTIHRAEKIKLNPDITEHHMVGGWTEQLVTSPTIIEYAKKATKTFNLESNDRFYYSFIAVTSAKSKIVSGSLHNIQFRVGETNVMKNKVSFQNVNCTQLKPIVNGKQQLVFIKVWTKPWESNFEKITITGFKQI